VGERILYLVRHGQCELEPPGRHADLHVRRLTALGRMQARLVARRLSALPISVIHHSTFLRAIETAQIIATQFPGIALRPSSLLCECTPSVPPAFADLFVAVPPGEIERDGLQAQKAFQKYFKPAGKSAKNTASRHEVIVCHGNIVRYFMCRALQVDVNAWLNTDVHNCGITEVIVKADGRLMLMSHNDTGHLPYDMRTFF